jgi:tetratricopeptide (TPR) repeat protein
MSCNQQINKTTAKSLTDSAISILKNTHDELKALPVLKEALKIDSNYFPALSAKLSCELVTNQPDKAMLTATKLIHLKPGVSEYYTIIGLLYEMKADTIASKRYFTEAIIRYDQKLNTMKIHDRKYDLLLFNKAFNLVLIRQNEKGNQIMKALYDKNNDETFREMIRIYMNKSKQEILDMLVNEGRF